MGKQVIWTTLICCIIYLGDHSAIGSQDSPEIICTTEDRPSTDEDKSDSTSVITTCMLLGISHTEKLTEDTHAVEENSDDIFELSKIEHLLTVKESHIDSFARSITEDISTVEGSTTDSYDLSTTEVTLTVEGSATDSFELTTTDDQSTVKISSTPGISTLEAGGISTADISVSTTPGLHTAGNITTTTISTSDVSEETATGDIPTADISVSTTPGLHTTGDITTTTISTSDVSETTTTEIRTTAHLIITTEPKQSTTGVISISHTTTGVTHEEITSSTSEYSTAEKGSTQESLTSTSSQLTTTAERTTSGIYNGTEPGTSTTGESTTIDIITYTSPKSATTERRATTEIAATTTVDLMTTDERSTSSTTNISASDLTTTKRETTVKTNTSPGPELSTTGEWSSHIIITSEATGPTTSTRRATDDTRTSSSDIITTIQPKPTISEEITTATLSTSTTEHTVAQTTSTIKPITSISTSLPTENTTSTGYTTILTSVGIVNTTVTSHIPMTTSFGPIISTAPKYTSITTPFGPLTSTSTWANSATTFLSTSLVGTCNLLCTNGHCYIKLGTTTSLCRCNNGFVPDSEHRMCIDIDECELNTCQQQCSNTIGGYSCSCWDGYLANPYNNTQCIENDYCKSSPCANGECINGVYGPICICNKGWEGPPCDIDIDECQRNNPCSSHSITCENHLGSYECVCRSGWTGPICTIDVNECASNPCKSGRCYNTIGSYKCVCNSGFTGANCDVDIDECLSNPCRNRATCNNLENAFSCSCVLGFTGRFCEIRINYCSSTTCHNGGVCVSLINDFYCFCPSNWQGKICNLDVNECTSGLRRCSINAACTNTQGSYYCTCNPGFIGDGFNCKEDRLFEYKSGYRATRRSRDFTSPMINVPSGFPFGSSFYNTLYFTDNGVIIFRRNNYDPIYTMPYPLSTFYNYDYYTPPMIAVFWADADFSRMGELYYQTYDFQASPNLNIDFKTKLETEVNTYFSSLNFKATWAIKITWERVLPYPAYFFSYNSHETNTYQAVLVTDGIYSFCLMRFADGGMNWRYYSLPTYYMPKMGYFSGQPSYYSPAPRFPAFNDPHTDYYVSIQKKYTPDQYIGYNTNKKGYWAYRLEYNTANRVNPQQRCLSWYYNEIYSNTYPYWMYYARPCPCTYWQARVDSSYTSASRLQSYGFQQKIRDSYSQYYTYQTAFSTWFGGGTRCYYSYWGSLSYGEKERYLPTPWEYENSWLRWWNSYYYYYYYYSYYQSLLAQQRKQYKENEVDPYNNCCKYSSSSQLCSLYRRRRPYDYCFGYVPPRPGNIFGDPHINTLDGVQYTFNGLGEFILTNIRDENDTEIFRLQGRTAIAGNDTQATNFVGLAALINNETTVEWILRDSNTTIVKINGTEFTLPDNSTYISKVTLEKTSNEIEASFDGGISVTVSAKVGALSFVTMLETTYKNKTKGLLGVFNDDKTDDLMAANGTKLEYNGVKLPNESLIFEIGMTWKTTPLNSIFIYNETDGESWYTYNNNTFVPLFYDELLQTSDPDTIKKANETCNGNDECIFDILSTGDDAAGEATLDSVLSAVEQKATINNFPPNVTGPSTISTQLFQLVTEYYTATDDNGDTVIFSLQTDSSDINITADGELVWYPTSSAPINAIVAANDSKIATEVILTLVLCNCTNDGSCMYDSATSLGNETTTFQVAGCNCSAAWTGMYCDEDFDGCAENKCFDNNTCVDRIAPEEGFDCGSCPASLTGDGITCTDINECYLNTSTCQQVCNDFLGGYNCSCDEGYVVNALDSSMCDDIDECANDTSPCAENTNCTNLPGTYSCQCLPGYEGNVSIMCVDIDECALNLTNCPIQSVCINTNGSYICECLLGYSGANCIDINECLENTTCPTHAICTNTPGSYHCDCEDGYGGENCTDIDECFLGVNNCSFWANCNNTEGSYICTCRSGYSGDGMHCVDIDECYENYFICGSNASCSNTNGSYDCICTAGYTLGNGTCVDIDECSFPQYCTGIERICINTEGSFTCVCQQGYKQVNESCIDINECTSPEHNNCSANAVCSNVAGSFQCECMINYTGDGVNCTIVDECHLNTTQCEQICTSFVGGHICSCEDGFKVNELNSSKCDEITTTESPTITTNASLPTDGTTNSVTVIQNTTTLGMNESTVTSAELVTNTNSVTSVAITVTTGPENRTDTTTPGPVTYTSIATSGINTTIQSPSPAVSENVLTTPGPFPNTSDFTSTLNSTLSSTSQTAHINQTTSTSMTSAMPVTTTVTAVSLSMSSSAGALTTTATTTSVGTTSATTLSSTSVSTNEVGNITIGSPITAIPSNGTTNTVTIQNTTIPGINESTMTSTSLSAATSTTTSTTTSTATPLSTSLSAATSTTTSTTTSTHTITATTLSSPSVSTNEAKNTTTKTPTMTTITVLPINGTTNTVTALQNTTTSVTSVVPVINTSTVTSLYNTITIPTVAENQITIITPGPVTNTSAFTSTINSTVSSTSQSTHINQTSRTPMTSTMPVASPSLISSTKSSTILLSTSSSSTISTNTSTTNSTATTSATTLSSSSVGTNEAKNTTTEPTTMTPMTDLSNNGTANTITSLQNTTTPGMYVTSVTSVVPVTNTSTVTSISDKITITAGPENRTDVSTPGPITNTSIVTSGINATIQSPIPTAAQNYTTITTPRPVISTSALTSTMHSTVSSTSQTAHINQTTSVHMTTAMPVESTSIISSTSTAISLSTSSASTLMTTSTTTSMTTTSATTLPSTSVSTNEAKNTTAEPPTITPITALPSNGTANTITSFQNTTTPGINESTVPSAVPVTNTSTLTSVSNTITMTTEPENRTDITSPGPITNTSIVTSGINATIQSTIPTAAQNYTTIITPGLVTNTSAYINQTTRTPVTSEMPVSGTTVISSTKSSTILLSTSSSANTSMTTSATTSATTLSSTSASTSKGNTTKEPPTTTLHSNGTVFTVTTIQYKTTPSVNGSTVTSVAPVTKTSAITSVSNTSPAIAENKTAITTLGPVTNTSAFTFNINSTITSTSQQENINQTASTSMTSPMPVITTSEISSTISSISSTTSIPISLSTSSTSATSTTTSSTTSTATTTMTSTTAISVTTLSSTSANMNKAVQLFDYGLDNGDTSYIQRKADFTSPLFQPVMGFPFGNQIRNYVYYTDNGQIVFPKSRNSIFSYTNPPPNGFSANHNVASIAVFWSDADFSKNMGTTYYQIYNQRNDTVIQLVEDMIRKYMKTSYTAQWTLKITWEKVPAYPAKDNDNQTNTYQAVLTTDGFVSYVLLLYKDGGMNWAVTERFPKPLIGYCSGNRDQFFINDKISVNIYRPNNYVGINSDLRGLWIYSLNSTALDNSRMKCLNWSNEQPAPSSWNLNLLSCPCLYRQGISDFRYRVTNSGKTNSINMLRSTSPNWYNAGVRCVYYRKNQYLEGYQERTWRFSISGMDQELDAYDLCCNQVEDPQFCSMYMQKRPPINCRDYRPLMPGWMFGDPHITTLDGLSYTFNGLGDFILVNASDVNTSFMLQGRTVQFGTAMATNFQAFAVQYTSPNASVKVEWYLEEDDNITSLLGGQNVLFSRSEDMDALINNTNPAVFLLNDGSITATFEGLLSVSVSAYSRMLSAVTSLPSNFLNKTEGLLGNWNNDQSDDFLSPNGTNFPSNSSEEDIFHYGMLWEVKEMNLFTRNHSNISSMFKPVFLSYLLTQDPLMYADMQEKCGNKTECIFDAMSTNNTDLGLATLSVSNILQETNTTLNAVPPSIDGNTTIQAFIMSSVTVQYTANGTEVIFTAEPVTNSDINVTAKGSLTWSPTSTSEFTLSLVATDSQNLSSAFQPNFVVCNCAQSSQCDYNTISKVNGSSLSIAGCNCTNHTGEFCQTPPDLCLEGCFPGVSCHNDTGCDLCPAGFSGDGRHCADIDECVKLKPCSIFAECTNLPGSYNCTCYTGFMGNGTFCADINECLNNSICSINATCTNTIGSYICSCKDGFTGDGTSCSCAECEANYCSHDRTCTRIGSSCTPKCDCVPPFSGDRCTTTSINIFQAQFSPDLKKRSVIMIVNSTEGNFTYQEAYKKIKSLLNNAPINVTHLFEENDIDMESPHNRNHPVYSAKFTARFTYVANTTIITFLNDQLVTYLQTQTPGKRSVNLIISNVTEGEKLTLIELQGFASCYSENYTLNNETFECVSNCILTSYCKNDGTCELIEGEFSCKCMPSSMYITSGSQCENLTINLNTFFGILFGAFAFILLLLLGIWLGIRYYQRNMYTDDKTDEMFQSRFSWQPYLFPSFNKLGEAGLVTDINNVPHLDGWKPQLEKINSLIEIKIKRPEIKSDLNNH